MIAMSVPSPVARTAEPNTSLRFRLASRGGEVNRESGEAGTRKVKRLKPSDPLHVAIVPLSSAEVVFRHRHRARPMPAAARWLSPSALAFLPVRIPSSRGWTLHWFSGMSSRRRPSGSARRIVARAQSEASYRAFHNGQAVELAPFKAWLLPRLSPSQVKAPSRTCAVIAGTACRNGPVLTSLVGTCCHQCGVAAS